MTFKLGLDRLDESWVCFVNFEGRHGLTQLYHSCITTCFVVYFAIISL